jgi:hypothetical protein
VAAAQMTDEISIQVSYGDLKNQAKSYTVRQYAEYILSDTYVENKAYTKLLVQWMLNYGAAAQNYFTYNTDNLANKDHELENTYEIPEAEAGNAATGTVSGISYYGASLLLRSKTAVRFYFEAPEIDGFTFTANGKPYLPVEKQTGLYYVEIDGINPQELSESITLTVTKGGETLTIVYGPMNYIVKMGATGSAALKELMLAMYNYHLSAVNFFVKSL